MLHLCTEEAVSGLLTFPADSYIQLYKPDFILHKYPPRIFMPILICFNNLRFTVLPVEGIFLIIFLTSSLNWGKILFHET